MVLLDKGKIIERITDELFSYISKLEETKSEFIKVSNDYNKLKSLYSNINYNINNFIIVYGESSENKRKYFKSIVNEIYNDKKDINTLYEEMKNAYLLCVYNPHSNLNLNKFNDFLNKLSLKINSLNLMIEKDNLDSLDNKILQLMDFSNIFCNNSFIDYCDSDLYINIINSLNLTDDEKIFAIELGIREFNKLHQLNESVDLEEYIEDNEENNIEKNFIELNNFNKFDSIELDFNNEFAIGNDQDDSSEEEDIDEFTNKDIIPKNEIDQYEISNYIDDYEVAYE